MTSYSRIATTVAVLLFYCLPFTYGQDPVSPKFDLTSPTKMYDPSQQASSMTKVADIPVSYYTGKPNVNFPFHTLKAGNISVSMSLGYGSFGGIPVEQEGSWVGLGWDLNIGGAITRSISGKADDNMAGGYVNTANSLGLPVYSTPTPYNWLSSITNCDKKSMADGMLDCSPDIYFVSFEGQSAKMFFDKNGVAYISPYKKWRVLGTPSTGFTIITETGTKYIFNTIEVSNYDVVTNPGSDAPSLIGRTAWFLTSMISANLKDTIQFNYTAVSYENDIKIPSMQRFDLVPGQVASCPPGHTTPPDQSYTTTSTNLHTINSAILSSIVSNAGKLEFISTADRADMTMGNKYRLREVNMYTAKGKNYTFLKKIRFYQSFSNSSGFDPIQKRLLLDSVTEVSNNDSMVHRFSYINPGSLPKKNSYGQDHWGFYNAKVNSTLIPAYTDIDGSTLDGANREPDSVATQIGLLNSITYPTGGTVSFEYEQNDFTHYRNNSIYEYTHLDSTLVDKNLNCNTNTLSTPNGEVTKSVFLKGTQTVDINYLVTGRNPSDPVATVWITNEAGTIVFSAGVSSGTVMTASRLLAGGQTYTLHAERTGTTERGVITLLYKEYATFTVPTVYSLPAGGCRIKRITQYDGLNHANDIITRFKYMLNDTLSSGVLLDYPNYVDLSYVQYLCKHPDPSNPIPAVKGGDWIYRKRQSASTISLGRTQGSPIGYSKITVLKGENGENGYEENYYTLTGLNDTGGSGYPYTPRNSKDDLRGLLLQNRQYNNIGKVVKATVNEYELNNNPGDPNYKWTWGAKFGVLKSSNSTINGCPGGNEWSILGGMYQIFQYWPVVKSTTDTLFDVVNNTYLTTTRNFTYDSINTQLSREDLISSDSSIVSTVYTYPNNYTGIAVYDSMTARNMFPVIEKTTLRNNIQTSREKTNFGFYSGMIQPLTKDFIAANAPLETRINFYAYDTRGNLVDQGKTSDVHEVYLWGYNRQYPVAKIVGSTYAAINGLVTDSILQNPPSDAALRTELNKIRTNLAGSVAQVTTYTYLPGIGVSSETTPAGRTTYFEYDGLGQLKVVKDQNGQIIKLFDYKRQVPINQ